MTFIGNQKEFLTKFPHYEHKEVIMYKIWIILLAVTLTACGDYNSEPKYGERSGLSVNCRAYVQASIDGWRYGEHDIDDTMDALERNCGIAGELWDYRP